MLDRPFERRVLTSPAANTESETEESNDVPYMAL